MIGYGLGREASETRWDTSWQETTGVTGFYRGYKWSAPYLKRWGPNTAEGTTTITYENGVKTSVFSTEFRTGAAQATTGDSGGGVFLNDGTLAGIMISVSQVSGQPGGTSIYTPGTIRSKTYMADISAYRPEILGIVSTTPVPEPRVAVLLELALLAVCGRAIFKKAPAAPR
jgi:hypothetical protein